MKQYTIAEYAQLIGASTTTVYRRCSTVLNAFHKVLNGKHFLVFPDNIDPMTLADTGEVFKNNVEATEGKETPAERVVQIRKFI